MEKIDSVNNEKIKRLASLKDKKFRDQYGSFIVEGAKLVKEVVSSCFDCQAIYVDENCQEKYKDILSKYSGNIYVLGKEAFSKIATTIAPQGIVAEVKKREMPKLVLNEPFLVLDNMQDPGNMGTILRTAVAVGIKKVLLLSCVDPYGPKVVRASSGAVLNLEIHSLDFKGFKSLIEQSSASLYVADMDGENIFLAKNIDKIFGLVIGSEGQGVSKEVSSLAKRTFSLPMDKKMESLNASVSGSILLYELCKSKFC